MFRSKHVYTCPDVIHDRKVAKKNAIATLVVNGLFVAGLWAVGRRMERKFEEELKEAEETLEPTS